MVTPMTRAAFLLISISSGGGVASLAAAPWFTLLFQPDARGTRVKINGVSSPTTVTRKSPWGWG